MLALLHKGLSEHGHEVMIAPNGAEGLKLTLDQEFDVILLDVGLPDLNGFDVAQVLRERRCPASILMLTAYSKEDEIVRGLNLGADDYLTKLFLFQNCWRGSALSLDRRPCQLHSASRTWLPI